VTTGATFPGVPTTIPTSLDDISASWLTELVRDSPVGSPDAVVSDRTLTVLGTGEGFSGDLARVEPVYEAGSGPSSLIVKLPTSIAENRAGGEMLGVYEREIRMYDELLPTLEVPLPHLYHGAFDPNPIDVDRQMVWLPRIDRLPIWLLRGLARLMQLAGRQASDRRSVMVIEDLAPAVVGDQVAGCDLDTTARVLTVAARLHAATWGERAPAISNWLQRADVAPRLFHAGFLEARKGFLQRAEPFFSDHTTALVRRVRREGPELIRRVHRATPPCLLHGDLRLDNMFFDGDGEVRALIDWQIANIGPSIIDVSYFICGSLDADVSEDDVDALLAGYHAELLANGVSDLPLARLVAAYHDALLLNLHRIASLDAVEFGDDRGVALIDEWLRRIDTRLRRLPA